MSISKKLERKKLRKIVSIRQGWIYLFFFFFMGCSNLPYRGNDVLGADAFVIDSYKIKKGKFSILEMEGCPLMELNPILLKEYKDTIENGDILEIALYHPSRKDLMLAVREIGETVGFIVRDKKIYLPDLTPIEVAGLTLSEGREKIQKRYDLEITDVQVFLSYKRRKEQKISLTGLTAISSVPIDGKKRLFDVLSEAKVPPNANFFKSYLVRKNALLPVDMYKLVVQGDMSQNIVMRGEDKIYIAPSNASSLMVMGEVREEKVIDLPNGFMPLRQALALSGGIPYTGNKRCIQVIRGNILHPKIYTLSWQHVMKLPNTSLLLMPGDIVYVAATPITEWNRFIKQIFPTLTGIELFRKGVSGVVAIE